MRVRTVRSLCVRPASIVVRCGHPNYRPGRFTNNRGQFTNGLSGRFDPAAESTPSKVVPSSEGLQGYGLPHRRSVHPHTGRRVRQAVPLQSSGVRSCRRDEPIALEHRPRKHVGAVRERSRPLREAPLRSAFASLLAGVLALSEECAGYSSRSSGTFSSS